MSAYLCSQCHGEMESKPVRNAFKLTHFVCVDCGGVAGYDKTWIIKCPECEANSVQVSSEAWFDVTENGSAQHQDDGVEFDDNSPAVCSKCGHEATWGDFHKPGD